MDHRKYMTILKLDEAAIARRRAFFGIDEGVLARLASLRPLADKITDGIVEDFYALLLSHPDTKKFFPDEATIRRVKRTQREFARTVVQLGLDVSSMHTVSRLSDGIELALGMVGKAIASKGA